LDRRNKFCLLPSRVIGIVNNNVIYISKEPEEGISNGLITKK
jgi:hypothetical protein